MEEINDLETCAKIASSSAHYYHGDYKVTYCETAYDYHDEYLKTIGLGKYKVGEIIHTFEDAYADFWKRRGYGAEADDPFTRDYVKYFFSKFKSREDSDK